MSTDETKETIESVDFSSEMIDGMVITLDNTFTMAGDKIPDYVKESGQKFVADLNRWSDSKKN